MAFKTGGGDELNSEINVTPMVDVMLVLLIIFMITAPLLQNTGVTVDLPAVQADAPDDPESPLVMEINADRSLKLGKTKIAWKDLGKMIKANDRVQKEKKLYIAGNKDLPYSVVATAMALVKRAGVEHVLLLTNPAEELSPEQLDQNVGR
jgi:biopolymer transport protein TolR